MTDVEIYRDLRKLFGPARDQGVRPTCLPFAASDAHAALRDGWSPLSCEYVYFHAQRRSARPPTSGATLPSILEVLRHDGQPIEADWPYLAQLPSDLASWCPPSNIGSLFRRAGSIGSSKLDAIINLLEQGRPVILLMTLSPSFFLAGPDGIVDPALNEAPEPSQRHAVIATGHGKVKGQRAILVRNSWGANWAMNGHAWLTERFLSPRLFNAATLMEELYVSSRPAAA
ncbi:MAG: C1 family peptidase [Pseudomonadota bacterium]|nr:C1 family peptidase [Pseudomonadota bacterium]